MDKEFITASLTKDEWARLQDGMSFVASELRNTPDIELRDKLRDLCIGNAIPLLGEVVFND